MNEPGFGGGVEVDLSNCDREPIHIPGSIQPHGALVAFVLASMEIVSAGANTDALLGIAAEALCGESLAVLLDANDLANVAARIATTNADTLDAFPVEAGVAGRRVRWTALVHRGDGLGILELEPIDPPRVGPSTLLLLGTAARALQAARDQNAACQVVATAVREIITFDRVKIYRFATDWSGEVLAEARDDAMASYLGLHFPASDIPSQARALYESNPVRLIADVGYRPAPLVPDRNPVDGGPIDLRFATLRSVSPIHVEYLRNMGVGASMSGSILRNGALWGLIACHHRTPLTVDFERRQACALLAQLLAAQLDTLERVERARRSGRVEALRSELLSAAVAGDSVTEALGRHELEWMRLVGATGFAMTRPDRIVHGGVVPDAAFLRLLTDHLSNASDADSVAIDRLGTVMPEARAVATYASGLLAVPLSRSDGSYLLWFRPEQRQTVTWAGEPVKPRKAGWRPEEVRLYPRTSFQAWTEEVRGRSIVWSGEDVAAALQLREVMFDLFVREKDELERQNIRLAMGARDLETFLYVASHDIKEPLRQMEMLSSLLREHVSAPIGDEAEKYFRDFTALATHLRKLTDELATYAKLGRHAPAPGPVRVGEVVAEVTAQFDTALATVGGTIHAGPLPTVLCERTQLHQVFVNLVGNAIKYRAPYRALHIRITGSTDAASEDPDDIAAPRRMAKIVVADNGIGFDPKYDDRVFEPFLRLHSMDRYEGNGIGLAICRRIVERYRGRIAAHGSTETGATFTLVLPAAHEVDRMQSQPSSP